MSSIDDVLGFSLRERLQLARALQRQAILQHAPALDDDLLWQIIACLGTAEGLSTAETVALLSGGNPLDDAARRKFEIRLAYEELYAGPHFRDVPGWGEPDLAILESVCRVHRSPQETAVQLERDRSVERLTRGTHSSVQEFVPVLVYDRGQLPPGVLVSRLASSARLNEPLVVAGAFAYPVTLAWMLVPEDVASTYAGELHKWMQEHWPEALDICTPPTTTEHFDREALTLAIEAFARNMTLEDAAVFVFGARAADAERYV